VRVEVVEAQQVQQHDGADREAQAVDGDPRPATAPRPGQRRAGLPDVRGDEDLLPAALREGVDPCDGVPAGGEVLVDRAEPDGPGAELQLVPRGAVGERDDEHAHDDEAERSGDDRAEDVARGQHRPAQQHPERAAEQGQRRDERLPRPRLADPQHRLPVRGPAELGTPRRRARERLVEPRRAGQQDHGTEQAEQDDRSDVAPRPGGEHRRGDGTGAQ
jgi:hypothetical protein